MSEYRVFLAKKHSEAKKIAKKYKPDLAIVDMKLSGESGLNTLCQLKKIHPKIKTILMTAYGENELVNDLEEKADYCLFKPFDILQLRKKVGNILKKTLK